MNSRQMIEFAATVSAYSPALIESPAPLPREGLQDYWSCSRARFRHWHAWLDAFPDTILALDAGQRALHWERTEAMLSEIFLTELVTRVCGAVLCARDQSQKSAEATMFARNVFTGHLQARQWALRLMLDAPFTTIDQIARVDRLRRRVERWTDLLLGHLVTNYDVADFAFDLERSLDFGAEQVRESQGPRKYRIWQLYLVCLRTAFPDEYLLDMMQLKLRQEVLQALLGCFPADMFQTSGAIKPVWLFRLQRSGELREGPPAVERTESLNPRLDVPSMPAPPVAELSPSNPSFGNDADLLDRFEGLRDRMRPSSPGRDRDCG